jgi:hypothetical protein
MHDYVTAERRGRDSLRRFLLDLDAKETNDSEGWEGRTIGEVIELYFELDAHPRNHEGLAPKSYEQYRGAADRHILGKASRTAGGIWNPPLLHALDVVVVPAVRFNEPQAPRAWREQMLRAGVAPSIRRRAWVPPIVRVELGSALTSGARDPDQRMPLGQRANRQSATVGSRRRHWLRPRTSSSARSLGTLTASCRGYS